MLTLKFPRMNCGSCDYLHLPTDFFLAPMSDNVTPTNSYMKFTITADYYCPKRGVRIAEAVQGEIV